MGSSLLFGCFDPSDEGGGEPAEPLTHESAHALLTTNIQSTSSSLEERLRFLDGDERLMEAFNTFFGGGEDESCYFDYDDEGNEVEVCEDWEEEGPSEDQIRIDFMEGTEDMISMILEELPQDLQIAEEEQLTYRLNASRLCESTVEDDWDEGGFEDDYEGEPAGEFIDEEWEDEERDESEEMSSAPVDFDPEMEPEVEIDPDCLRIMEQEEPRVRLQAAGDGIEATLLLNQGREALVTATLNSGLAKVKLDLGSLTRIIESIDSNGDDSEEEGDFDLDLSGVISLEMDMQSANRATFRVNVDEAIRIVGRVDDLEEINFTFPAARDVFSISSDSETPALSLALALPKLVQSLQVSLNSDYEYDEETGEEILIEEGPLREIIATLGGLNFGFDLRLVDEGIATTIEVGLGQESSSIAIDGNQVITVDLNPSNGRLIAFNFDHSSVNEESMLLKLASELHALNVDLKLGLIPEIEAPLGFADELYRVAFTSLSNKLPSLRIGGADHFIQVIDGKLEIEAERGGMSHTAEGGMCINPIEESEEGSFEESESYEESYEEPEPEHPLEMLEVNACGANE